MVSVLLDGTTWDDADLAKIDSVINLWPGQFSVSIFRFRVAAHIDSFRWVCVIKVLLCTGEGQITNSESWVDQRILECKKSLEGLIIPKKVSKVFSNWFDHFSMGRQIGN
jgi:hypothetical protein